MKALSIIPENLFLAHLYLLDDVQGSREHGVVLGDGLDREGFGKDGYDARDVGVVWPQDERVVALDQVAKVIVDVGRLFVVFHHR